MAYSPNAKDLEAQAYEYAKGSDIVAKFEYHCKDKEAFARVEMDGQEYWVGGMDLLMDLAASTNSDEFRSLLERDSVSNPF